MSVNGLNTSLSGLDANQFRIGVSANNVANVNTDGFKASEVQTTDAAYVNDIGQGTRVAATYAPNRPGPVALDATAPGGTREQSNTDMVREMTNQMSAQNAYGANIAMARTVDAANQTLMDIKS